MKLTLLAGICASLGIVASIAVAQTPSNPALNTPDQVAWTLFLQVNANAATSGNNDALFETWPDDGETFRARPAPRFVATHRALRLSPRALLAVHALPPGSAGEETHRNPAAYEFIVSNHLYSQRGLQQAFGTSLVFPVDAIEVKANWYPVNGIPGYSGDPAKAYMTYHVAKTADGQAYALVSMHVISKLVPNWTWATFEHKDNPARCDVLGCRDLFGAQSPYVPPNSTANAGYGACPQTGALQKMFASQKMDPAFTNYCLKGTQTDFTDATGLAQRLGNSIIEEGFVGQSSCMTCHARAAFDRFGKPASQAGFDAAGNALVGAVDPAWFWMLPNPGPPLAGPITAGGQAQTPAIPTTSKSASRIATPADFVWSIPFCAIDDTDAAHPQPSRFCAAK